MRPHLFDINPTRTTGEFIVARTTNMLKAHESYKLARLVSDAGQFETWHDALTTLSVSMGRQITKPNVRTACKSVGRELFDVVKEARTRGQGPLSRLHEVVAELMVRVEALEAAVGSIEEK